MTTYSSQAITDFKKKIAHNAIKMMFEEKGVGWEGDASTGFNQGSMIPYPAWRGTPCLRSTARPAPSSSSFPGCR